LKVPDQIARRNHHPPYAPGGEKKNHSSLHRTDDTGSKKGGGRTEGCQSAKGKIPQGRRGGHDQQTS